MAGVRVVPLPRLADDRGAVYHMLRSDDPHFTEFGEIYFSTVYAGVVKAWKNHRRLTANYACIHGRIKIVLYDDRPESPTRGELMEIDVSPDEYALVVIPPGIWHGFQGLAEPISILANCASEPHDPEELDRRDPYSNEFPYHWRRDA
ncbi:MAG: dTDP-4-dehydrorhamnose 3,5-epimerase family protein [Actinobacteria bacterium]|nr:dTDP-4-dehydrorhamnose 3,5-epimerase family protein [Actinomycetota bacterium]